MPVEIQEIQNHDDFLYAPWMSVILLSGPPLQSTLKLHYYNNDARNLTACSLGASDADISTSMLTDSMKELTNLFAGEIKAQLFHNEILVGISLPLITRGFDEVLFSDQFNVDQVSDYWVMKCGEKDQIILSTETEVFNPEIFNKVGFVSQAEEEDEGDIDFL